MIKSIKLVLSIILLGVLSCNEKTNESKVSQDAEESNLQHLLISKIIDTIATYESPRSLWPSPPPNKKGINILTKEDSIKHKKLILKYLDKFRTIAIDTNLVLYLPDFKNSKKIIDTKDYLGIKKSYDSLKNFKIDIGKIKLTKTKNNIYFDSITYLSPSKHIRKTRGGTYIDIDFRFNFSKIVYNDKRDKAIVSCEYRFEDRYPKGVLFYFERIEDDWIIMGDYRFLEY